MSVAGFIFCRYLRQFLFRNLHSHSCATDNGSMRYLWYTILTVVAVLLTLLLWTPPLSTGDRPTAVVASAR
jgi:hypothetical protein